ncbi:MAG: CBS domain-containing protein [Planctomycetes bacterium]|nr:CBS domain-containing protein [Planctomycetota bacterium]
MTAPVTTVTEDLPCRAALRLFREKGFRRAPVMRGDLLVGMVSERDLVRVLPSSVADLDSAAGLRAERALVGQVMAKRPEIVGPDAHLEDVARVMLQKKIGGMPVVEGRALVGIITETDLFRALLQISDRTDGVRLTLATPAGTRSDDVALISLRIGLRLVTLLTHESPGGAPLVTLRAVGARWRELPDLLAKAGYAVIQVVPPALEAA